MTTQALLRDARATGETIAAIDHLLQLGYDRDRADRASRPYEPPTFAMRLAWAQEALEAAQDAFGSTECEVCQAGAVHGCEDQSAVERAEAAVAVARAALAESDEPRTYTIRDEGASWDIESRPSTLDEDVEESVRDGDWWNDGESWVWRGESTDSVTGDTELHTVEFEGRAPECARGKEHDWRTPYAVLGGLKDNPGVQGGPNGGITARSVCGHCGAYRVYVSRKTDMSNGQTFEATDYEPADEDSLEWIAAGTRANKVTP
jgi:hypothetical protein